MNENMDWIRAYESGNLSNGHFTSVCDPFLILLSHLTDYDICHMYLNKHPIWYRNAFNHSKTVLKFRSTSGHFEFVERTKE